MPRPKLIENQTKVQFLCDVEEKEAFFKWCKENRITATELFRKFMATTIKNAST